MDINIDYFIKMLKHHMEDKGLTEEDSIALLLKKLNKSQDSNSATVRIKNDLEVGRSYGCFFFAEEMKPYLNKEANIVKTTITEAGFIHYRLDIDNQRFGWTDEMLDTLDETKKPNKFDIVIGHITSL